jgi:sugar lactone lactonase YvrE
MWRMTNLSERAATALGMASLAMVLITSACGGGGAEACATEPGTGTLAVRVSGLPAGASAAVTVGTTDVTADMDLTLAAGPHPVEAATVAQPGTGLVRNAYAPKLASSMACVGDGQTTTVSVEYALIPTSGKLWVGTAGAPADASLLGFASASLAATGTRAAARVTNTAGSSGFAFDRDGNVWIIGGTIADPPLARYPASVFSSDGDKFPDVTIDSPSFGSASPGAQVVAFDPQGNLWVSVVAANKLVRFTPAQLESGGEPVAAVEQGGIPAPAGIAFDVDGNLWVAAKDGPAVMRIDAAHLTTTGTGADLTITATSPPPVVGTLPPPIGLAFDAGGALWVNYDGVIARLAASDLSGSGAKTITPGVQIQTDVLSLPSGIAFDELGGLWFAYGVKQIARLGPTQLSASGSIAPQTVVTSDEAGAMDWVALYPAPAALPLWHRLP